MCFASRRECALLFGERYAHGARGETLLFPPCTPFSPVCCIKACGTLCGFFKLEALAPFPAPREAVRLSARCHSAAPNILGAVAAPLCSDSLPRPLRARHRRASPRVLEKAQGCSAHSIGIAQLEAREGASPTADHMAAAPCRHRALSRLLTARGGEEASASNRKEAA